MIRAALIAAVCVAAILTLPYALNPALNSADLILWAAPFAVLWIGGTPRLARRGVSAWMLRHSASDTHPECLNRWERTHGLPETESEDQ